MKPRISPILLAAALPLFVFVPSIRAQQSTAREAPTSRAARASGPIAVDGRLDDAAWAVATPIDAFLQTEPSEGQPATERTEVRIVYDGDALYIGARLHDSGPVAAPLLRRDQDGPGSDWLSVTLDSYHDHRGAFHFDVNPAGARADAAVAGEVWDYSWNAVWDAAASVDSGGWTAEMRIPFSQLRFSGAEEQTWGMQIQRVLRRKQERTVFAFTPRSEPGGIATYGHLAGLDGIRATRRLEVLPYTVARGERVDRGANPFRRDAEYGAGVGLDLKYRLTSDLTLDATLNPDFGTVELDPAEVNLSAFETQLTERRPFFVEGAGIFDFGRGTFGAGNFTRSLFYSRRVGRRPQLGAPTSRADLPSTVTILGATKLTGKAGGWSVGVLDAVTQEEGARWMDDAGGERRSVAEPLTNYFAARAVRELRQGQTTVGGIVTATNRSLDDDAQALLRRSAYVGGVDFSHEFAGRAWRIAGYAAASRVEGTPEAIAVAQRSSARYLQQPDAGHLGFDPARTSLAGYTAQLQVNRQGGEHWRGDLSLATVSAGYEVNDLGYLQRSDATAANGRLTYLQNTPGRLFRSYRIDFTGWMLANGAGERFDNGLFLGSDWRLASYWRVILNTAHVFPSFNDRLTRGGPLAARPREHRLYTEVQSDPAKPVTAAGALFLRGGRGGSERDLWLRVGLQSSDRWTLSVTPRLNRLHQAAQYVTAVDDALAAETFGRRYVFADMRQTTFGLETRLAYTFTPDLSLQVYAQPYVVAATFSDYKELARPRAFDFAVYGRDRGTVAPAGSATTIDPDGDGAAQPFRVGERFGQRDFVMRSLKGSAVLRWEWRPGSTLHLAWQQEREATDQGMGDFRFGRERAALFGAAPDNVFVVKLSYWLNP